jgi:hypothetical protein
MLHRLTAALIAALVPTIANAQIDAPQTHADSIALAIAVYGVALSNGTQTSHGSVQPELVCVRGVTPAKDPPAEVIAALQENRTLLVRPMSAFKTEPLGRSINQALVVDTLTGKRAVSISTGAPEFELDGSFKVETAYYEHGLSAGGWLCKGKRRADRTWQVTTCTMLWIS